jgi:16S rRNA (cytosine967-C5)-methyltransferase
MKDSARIQTLITLLDQVEALPRPADAVISAYFRKNRYIGAKDRNAIAADIYDAMRHRARLTWWVNYVSQSNDFNARLMVIVYLNFVKKQSPADIGRDFNNEAYAPAFLDENEQKFLRSLKGRTYVHPHMEEPTLLECPLS